MAGDSKPAIAADLAEEYAPVLRHLEQFEDKHDADFAALADLL